MENMILYYFVAGFLYLTVFILVMRVYIRLTMTWNTSNVCLLGKTALITGGSSGLGYQTALILASRGARVIIANRSDSTEIKRKIIEETKNKNIVTKFLDLANLESVRRFAEEVNEEEERLDILINNAGVAGDFPGYTKDGLQLHMQINHFGPFLLTHLLADLLKKSAPSRIIFVSSLVGFLRQLTADKLNDNPNTKISYWNQYQLYSNSKLCNIISSIGFAEKLKGAGVTCNALHPGLVKTKMISSAMNIRRFWFGNEFGEGLAGLLGKTAYEGAQTQVYLAMADEVKDVTGKFFADCRVWFQPWKVRDKKLCEAIWKKSEELVKLAPQEKL